MEKESIGVELRALNNLIRRYFEFSSHKKENESITGNNEWIINFLAEHISEDIFQKNIEDYFTITRSTASKVLSLMEQKGLIERQAVTQDARLKKIVLTEKAWKVREIMMEDVHQLERTLTLGFQEEELDMLLSYFERMKRNLSKN
jgi:DNA-binding MarR family transcriptional regulator